MRRGRGRERGGRNVVRRTSEEEQQLLEAKRKAEDQDPHTPDFTATLGIKVSLPDEAIAGDFIKFFLTGEFFDLLVAQSNLYASQQGHGLEPKGLRLRNSLLCLS